MRRVHAVYVVVCAAFLVNAAPGAALADTEASVETHISGSSQMSVQIGNTVETIGPQGGGTVDVRIETVEDGVRRTSVFRKEMAPGETFRYATTTAVDTASSGASVSVHSAAFIIATSAARVSVANTDASADSRSGAASGTPDVVTEPRAPSRLLAVVTYMRSMLRSLFTWW